MWKHFALSLVSMVCATLASADITAQFREGAPKDRFTLTNASTCSLRDATVTLDLSTSKAGLIFDVTSAGAGVEVFQPLEMVAGVSALSQIPQVRDGDNRVSFAIKDLAAGERVAFTIDVDDTLGSRAITVNGAEISGATLRLSQGNADQVGAFNASARAQVPHVGCQS